MNLIDVFAQHPVEGAIVAASAAALATCGVVVGGRVARTVRQARTRRKAQGQGAVGAPAWTMLGAGIATIVSAEGMWETFGAMGLAWPLRILTFAFIEVMVIQSAVRARQSMRENYSPGVDGVAMWVLTCVSALLSASHEMSQEDVSVAVVMIRLAAPLIAAWGWERSMALERRSLTGSRGINWKITPERIVIKLGLADPTERTASEVAAQRRLLALAVAAKRARQARESGKGLKRAMRRLDKAMERAVTDGALGSDPDQQRALLGQLSVLYNADSLLDLRPSAPWSPQPTPPESPVPPSGPRGGGVPVPELPEFGLGGLPESFPTPSLGDGDSIEPVELVPEPVPAQASAQGDEFSGGSEVQESISSGEERSADRDEDASSGRELGSRGDLGKLFREALTRTGGNVSQARALMREEGHSISKTYAYRIRDAWVQEQAQGRQHLTRVK